MSDAQPATRWIDRVRITRDASVLPNKRWLVRYRGHLYPFPSQSRAMEAASDPAHLCRYTCICPVLDRRAGTR